MAKVQMGGTNINGRRPTITVDTHDYGHGGREKRVVFTPAMIKNEGATNTDNGRHFLKPKPTTPELAGSAEVQTTGTTAEEMKKKLAASMYPSSRGTRDYLRT